MAVNSEMLREMSKGCREKTFEELETVEEKINYLSRQSRRIEEILEDFSERFLSLERNFLNHRHDLHHRQEVLLPARPERVYRLKKEGRQ